MQMEPFLIGNQLYVAVANYMDERQNIETYSTIFRYDFETRKFNVTQKLKTFGAIDVKHVHIGDNDFLFVANSFRAHKGMHASTSNGVVYRYDEQSTFVPMQILTFDTEVTQFLPYLGDNQEFVLFVSMKEGPTKTYQFDGFTFYETPVTFTGGSLGRGVSKMRTHKINNDFWVIVVANSEMYRDTTNLFRVKFTVTMDYDFSKAFEMFDSWYKSVDEKLRTDRISEIYHEIESLRPPPGFGVINLEQTKVKVIQTDAISSASIPIDFVELKRAMQRADEIVTKDVVRRPKRLNDSMLQNDMNSSQIDIDFEAQEMPTTLTINELTVSESFLAESINGHKFSDLVCEDSDLVLYNFTVEKLVINDAANVEAIEKKLLESDERVKRDTSSDPSTEPLNLYNVIVEGHVNGVNFSYFVENVLRTNGDQRLEAPVNFGRLRAKSIQATDGKISNVDLASIARINANETVILSPIRFTQGIQVDKLSILERVNQIAIKGGKLDALLKRSREPQVLTGQKIFESIILLEPITLQGKINISSSVLSKMKPIVTVNEDLFIEDAVSFIGNVSIKNLLSIGNMFGQSLRYNAEQVLADGLKLDEPVNVPLEFLQPLRIDDIQNPTRINNVPISSLLLRNVTDVQKVSAPKTFTSDLSVEGGNCDANEINGINLQILNNTMLKRSAKNQIVTGTIRFERITARKVKSDKLVIGKTPFDRLLTKGTDQNITGNVTIDGSIIMNNSELEIDHLFTQNAIFGVDLKELLDDSFFYSPNDSIVLTTDKTFEHLTIGQLVVEDDDFWQVGHTTGEITKSLEELSKGIRIKGPVTFASTFNITNLTVTDSINDIPSSSFGQQWLLSEGKQTFVVPQNFTDVTFNDNLQLYGLLNGNDIDQLFDDTVNKSEPVALKRVIFDNAIFDKSLNIGAKLSGIQIPDDLILSYSDTLQNFNEPLSFASDVEIVGTLSISETLNGFSHALICELLEPRPDSSQNLTIEGDVIFATDPTIEYLNSESFQYMLLTTWFRSDQYVNFSAGVHFSSAAFEKPITVAGLINDIDLHDLRSRYLSMNKPQKVSTPLRFHGRVHFMDSVTVETLSLGGLIKVPQSDITLNITDFDQNVLKNTKDTQFIRGRWTVNEIRFLGSLSATTVNGLNFAADVARVDRPELNIIRATKRFRSLQIDRLECRDSCTVQGVDMDDWISRAAMIGLNHTIQGTVYAQNPILSYIEASGLVNNMTINSQTVLLKKTPQTLKGPLIIGNRSRIDSINSLTFDNLYVNFINDKNLTDFFGNLVKKDGRGNDVGNIFSDLEFSDRVNFDNLNILGLLNGINVNEIMSQDHFVYGDQYRTAANELDTLVDKLVRRERFKHFKRFAVRTTFSLDIQGLQKLFGYDFQFVALNNSNIQLYTWNVTTKTLDGNNIPLALPENMVIIDLTVLPADPMHFLVIQMKNLYNGQFVRQFYDYRNGLERAQVVHEIVTDTETTIEPFNLDARHCFIQYRKFNATQFDVQCMDVVADSESKQQQQLMKVHQIDVKKTSEIYKIASGYANAIILWYINGEIESRWYDTQNRKADSCIRLFTNVTAVAVKQFDKNKFVTVCWHSNPIDGRADTIRGFASVYRTEGSHLEHYSDIEFSDSVILQCELTKFSAAQTILVIAVRTAMGEMLQIYQDKGVNGFQPLKEHVIRLKVPVPYNFINHIVPEKRFSLIESEDDILSFITVYSMYGVGFFECIYV
ncbi:uncharacterized protein LOC129577415 [Sitodiplosis mosellana]|uniref:uncharacterized protein LOC129577415 n=1 Tax=Sitodiplosis mosellana TaxID=263140 RepID=UPI002444A7A1|nr:uncharacterized protein LOC129577415 [Sitodiplosis mosellana]